jgi:carbamate kinase
MLTDVDAVQVDYGTPMARSLDDVDAAALRGHAFAAGSMGPKVDAACRFAERTGGTAGIGALADAVAILRGERGTRVHAGTRAAA